MSLSNGTSCRIELSVIRIIYICKTCLIQIKCTIQGHLQTGKWSNINKAVTSHGVSFRIVRIQHIVHNRISITDEWAGQASIEAVSVVHHLETVFIQFDTTVRITDISRIDRSLLSNKRPHISRRRARAVITQRIVIETGIRHVGPYFHPRFSLIISFQAGGQTFHIGIRCNTFITQISQ